MSKPVSVSNWLLQYLLKETAEKFPETACSNVKNSLPETQLAKVIKVLLSSACVNERSDDVITLAGR